jgi:hypothetical protein
MHATKPGSFKNLKASTNALLDTSHEMLTVPEVAERLRVPASWVYGHAELLGAYRLGKYLRFEWRRVLGQLRAAKKSKQALGSQPQRPSLAQIDSRVYDTHGTTREQKGLDIRS